MAIRRSLVDTTGPVRSTSEPLDAHNLQMLYEQYLGAIYRFVYSKVGNREEAEDLTSQVFLKAVRGLDQARDAQSVQSWLFQVARTTIADHWRAFYQLRPHSLDDLLESGWEGPVQALTPSEPSPQPTARVERILARLPARYRDVLTYRFLYNYSIKETATRMGLSEANVKVLQFRALKKASQIEAKDAPAVQHAGERGGNGT